MFDLSGLVALVSGAGSERGIGYACARALRDAGADVVISATTERVHDRARELGVRAVVADLMDPAQAERLAAEAGAVDILVNNAGMVQTGAPDVSGRFAELDLADWRTQLERTLGTAVNLTHAVLPGMLERAFGRVVFVSSVTGPRVAIDGSSAYGTAKSGLDGLMRELALEAGPSGVTVNSVAPGWIETASSTPDELVAGRHTPIGRPGTPDEVAAAVVFLAAREASYVAGHALVVDGGNTIQEVKGA